MEEVQKEREHILATLRTMPALGSDIDLATAVEKLASVVENEKKMEKQLTQDLEEKTEVRKIATEKVAKEQAELDRLRGLWCRNYCCEQRENFRAFCVLQA